VKQLQITEPTTRIDWFAAADAPNVIDAEPVEAAPRSPFGAGRHRYDPRDHPERVHVYYLAGIKPRKRHLFAPKPRLALLPGGGAK
jgi:hypothetical protein